MYLYDMVSLYQRDTSPTMYIAALFIVANTWNQQNVHAQVKGKGNCSMCMQWSVIMKQKLLLFAAKWMEL